MAIRVARLKAMGYRQGENRGVSGEAALTV
jgi:hypothetical protein